ncbi:hypothetical protein GAY28_36475 [Azospirillum brasilense]|nr:hypothetical protein [Azospirillum brasilense]
MSTLKKALLAATITAGLAAGFSATGAAAATYYEQRVATYPGGYDIHRGQTLDNELYLAVEGPDRIAAEIEAYARDSVRVAFGAAVQAAYNTPGEASVKASAAFSAFKATLQGRAAWRPAFRHLANRFHLTTALRGQWVERGPRVDIPDWQREQRRQGIEMLPPPVRDPLARWNDLHDRVNPPSRLRAELPRVQVPRVELPRIELPRIEPLRLW